MDEKREKSVDEAPNDVEDGDDSHHPKNDVNELYTEGGTILELDVVVSERRKDHGCTVGMVAIIEMDVNDNRAEGYAFIIVIVNVSHEHVVELHDEDLWREHVDATPFFFLWLFGLRAFFYPFYFMRNPSCPYLGVDIDFFTLSLPHLSCL